MGFKGEVVSTGLGTEEAAVTIFCRQVGVKVGVQCQMGDEEAPHRGALYLSVMVKPQKTVVALKSFLLFFISIFEQLLWALL